MGILDFLFGHPAQQPQAQGGLLSSAQPIVNQNAYRDYVIDTQSKGQPALSYADWVKAQQAQAQAQAPAKK